MLRVSVGFAVFASALAGQCSIKQWGDLLTAINTKTGTGALALTFGQSASDSAASEIILKEYNRVLSGAESTTAVGADCWTNCVLPRYTAFRGLWLAGDASANPAVVPGACKADATSTACKDGLAALALKDHFCATRNVVTKTTFARGGAIDRAAEPAYATVMNATVAPTASTFPALFITQVEKTVPTASAEPAFACYAAYYLAKLAGSGIPAVPAPADFTTCKALYIAPEGTPCPQAAIDAIAGTTAVQSALLLSAQPELTSLPILATAIAKDLAITDITTYSCFQCQETYLMKTLAANGTPLTALTTPALSPADKTAALTARDTCMLASVVTTTTTTDDGSTTTGSGVVSTGLSVVAVMAVALANL